MATRIVKICDVCNREYSERDCFEIPNIYEKNKNYTLYSSELQIQFHSDDPILGDNTIKFFNYDLCPNCAKYIVNWLKLNPK